MATSQIDIKSTTIELATESFEAFCEDISGMFGIEMECQQEEPSTETTKTLKKRFKKITAFNSIKSEGILDGTFQIAFDKEGLFTLAGTIVMLPEQRVLENRKSGSAQDAEDMSDAIGEAGNLLVGSWDRVFREELEGHEHFLQTNTFVGDPWSDPEKNIGLPDDTEFLFVPYEITIESYPPFHCGVIFQDEFFNSTPAAESNEEVSTEETAEEEAQEQETVAVTEDVVEVPEPEKEAVAVTEDVAEVPEPEPEPEPEAEAEVAAVTEDEAKVPEPEEEAPAVVEEKVKVPEPEDKAPAPVEEKAEAKEPEVEETVKPAVEPEQPTPPAAEPVIDKAEQPGETEDSSKGSVSESIQRIVKSSANLPGEQLEICSNICAEGIMQKQVLWADPEDTVQQAMTKMQQSDAGYILVGTGGAPEGIISDSDISGTISVYLKPIFTKWRRPTDDATLQIRVKWIMTKPVQTIKQDTSLTAIMNIMSQSGIRCLPVIDQQGKVSGLVTIFDILKALLNTDSDVSTTGKTNQAPPLE